MKHRTTPPITPPESIETTQADQVQKDPCQKKSAEPSAMRSNPKLKRNRVMILEGWKGMIALAGIVALVASLVLSIPGMVAMIVWNAVVHETFSGPTIAFHQGVLLGLMSLITFHLLFRPRYLNIAFDHGE